MVAELRARDLPKPNSPPRWITHAAIELHGQTPSQIAPGVPDWASPVKRRRGIWFPGDPRRRRRPLSACAVRSGFYGYD